jgi:glycosyltransferase involved in cell wall biosynthesis
MEYKKISIVTVNLNNEEGLKKTIESVINQTYFDKVNYIIIDGGSTDGSIDVIDKYIDYLSYYVSEKDNGVYNAMNKGIDVCNSEYIQFLNSGDYFHTNDVLEEIYEELDTDIVYGALNVHKKDGKTYIINDDYMLNKGLPHPSCFTKTEILKNHKFNENYKIISDWIFFFEEICCKHTPYKCLKTIVADFPLGGLSSDYNATETEKAIYLNTVANSVKAKIAMCSIGRMENRYVVEFVEFYHKLGVEKFFIYDNNYDGEEHFEEVLQPYIDDGIVEIIDFRNKSVCQLEAYQDCYDKHGDEYDWICFFDFDEFILTANNISLKVLLSNKIYNNFDMIHVNELIYGDSGNILYNNRPVIERFTSPVKPIDYKKTYKFPENCHVKSIVRGGIKNLEWKATPHTPSNKDIKCCNVVAQECTSNSPFVIPYVHKNMVLRHYKTKSIEEFYDTKVRRGYPDGNKDYFKNNSWILEFFTENDVTKEKLDFIDSLRKKEKLTVIMPCYNYAKYITETLDSLKKSTYDNWKCIIINDGSTDNSEEVILSQINGDSRFIYVKQENRGLSAVRNLGMSMSNTKYVMCLDPDDKISPTYLENGIKYLDEHDDCVLYYGKAKMFYDDGTEDYWDLPEYNYVKLLKKNCIYSSCILRKSCYDTTNGYDENMTGYEDWDFLIRYLHGNKKVYMTDDVVFYYRRHDGSMDNKAKKKFSRYLKYIYGKNKHIFDENNLTLKQ